MFDLWLNRYAYDKVCDSNLKICFAKFMPSIRLIHLKLLRFYNSTTEWKEITRREKSKEEKVWFPKMNDLSNFVTDLHFLVNQIIVTSVVGGSWSYLRHNFLFFFFLSPCFILINVNLLLVVSVTVPICLPFFVLYCCFVLRWQIWSVLPLSDWLF